VKRWFVIAVVTALVAASGTAIFFFWPASLPPAIASSEQPQGDALVNRGEYLATAGDCVACHTAPGGQAFAGGLAFTLPFGTLYSPNITPDRETGIGDWSDAEFSRALHRGIGRHGEDLYPAFPYADYALLSTDDVLAIKAYLFSLRPVRARVTHNSLIFPFDQRFVMRAWKLLFVPNRRFEPNASREPSWNRGAYLVEALGHCGECHTPRNLLFATRTDIKFSGAVVDGLKAYNITPDRKSGIGSWTDSELATYLSTGHAHGHGGVSGSMAEAIDLSIRKLDSADIASMVVYLRSITPVATSLEGSVDPNPAPLASSTAWSPPKNEGEATGLRIFESACASCHGWDGSGQQTDHAELRGARTVNDPQGTNLVKVVLDGVRIGSSVGDEIMPGFSMAYSDREIAALSNYVLEHFGAKQGKVTEATVATLRQE